MHSRFCKVYIYVEYMLAQTWFIMVALQSVVHFIFIKSETFLLVVKEDLIMTTLWVSSLCCAAGTTFVKFNGNICYPSELNICFELVEV